jgi:hypothetical protein
MTVVSPEGRERLSHPAQGILATCRLIRAAKCWPEMSREMPRADVNIGKRSLESQPKAGSISSSSAPQPSNRPSMGGALRIEANLPPYTKLWLSAWWKEMSGCRFLSIAADIASHGGRNRRRTFDEVEQ